MVEPRKTKMVIIGSGPAGWTAAIYAARANLAPIVIEGETPGGQLTETTEVENYPGFPDGIQGPELMELFKKQAEKFGTQTVSGIVTEVDFSERPFKVKTEDQEFETETVIIASGATANWLGLPNEQRLRGHGVSACATCDGFFFRDKEIAVIGGGDSAMEEAIFLTKFASKVSVIHRRDRLRATEIMQKRAEDNPKIEFVYSTVVTDVLGRDKVEGLKLKNVNSGEKKEFPIQGLFLAIGHSPSTKFLGRQVHIDDKGYVILHESPSTKTDVEGVFVAGDVDDHKYRQAVTAAAEGSKAAIDAENFLTHRLEPQIKS